LPDYSSFFVGIQGFMSQVTPGHGRLELDLCTRSFPPLPYIYMCEDHMVRHPTSDDSTLGFFEGSTSFSEKP